MWNAILISCYITKILNSNSADGGQRRQGAFLKKIKIKNIVAGVDWFFFSDLVFLKQKRVF
jgi:hypothetical protein